MEAVRNRGLSGSRPKSLELKKIRLDGDTQSRQELNEDVIKEYADLMAEGVEFPPLGVVFDGSSYWLWDGFHRRFAAIRSKLDKFKCFVADGTREDARWLSYGANKDHGLARNNEDKAKAVIAALKHPKGAKLSDTKLAEHVGVTDKTVAKYRDKLETSSEIPKIDTREVTRGGVTYEQKTSAIGKSPKQVVEVQVGENIHIGEVTDCGVVVSKTPDRKISGGITFDREELTSESKDAFGSESPEELNLVFQIVEGFKAQRQKLSSIKTWITQNINHPGSVVLASAESRVKADIDQADSELKFAMPYCVCVYCSNKPAKRKDCNACKGLGWITEPVYQAAPKGMKRDKAAS